MRSYLMSPQPPSPQTLSRGSSCDNTLGGKGHEMAPHVFLPKEPTVEVLARKKEIKSREKTDSPLDHISTLRSNPSYDFHL